MYHQRQWSLAVLKQNPVGMSLVETMLIRTSDQAIREKIGGHDHYMLFIPVPLKTE